MKAKNIKTQPVQATRLLAVLLSMLFTISLLLAVWVYFLSSQFKNYQKDTAVSGSLMRYDVAKLKFCVERAVASCDDTAISTWNKAHADDAFVLKPFEQIVNDGILDYQNSNR